MSQYRRTQSIRTQQQTGVSRALGIKPAEMSRKLNYFLELATANLPEILEHHALLVAPPFGLGKLPVGILSKLPDGSNLFLKTGELKAAGKAIYSLSANVASGNVTAGNLALIKKRMSFDSYEDQFVTDKKRFRHKIVAVQSILDKNNKKRTAQFCYVQGFTISERDEFLQDVLDVYSHAGMRMVACFSNTSRFTEALNFNAIESNIMRNNVIKAVGNALGVGIIACIIRRSAIGNKQELNALVSELGAVCDFIFRCLTDSNFGNGFEESYVPTSNTSSNLSEMCKEVFGVSSAFPNGEGFGYLSSFYSADKLRHVGGSYGGSMGDVFETRIKDIPNSQLHEELKDALKTIDTCVQQLCTFKNPKDLISAHYNPSLSNPDNKNFIWCTELIEIAIAGYKVAVHCYEQFNSILYTKLSNRDGAIADDLTVMNSRLLHEALEFYRSAAPPSQVEAPPTQQQQAYLSQE